MKRGSGAAFLNFLASSSCRQVAIKPPRSLANRGRWWYLLDVCAPPATTNHEPLLKERRMATRVNIGVIGAGGIAFRKTIPGMLKARNCRLIAVMDPVGVRPDCRRVWRLEGLHRGARSVGRPRGPGRVHRLAGGLSPRPNRPRGGGGQTRTVRKAVMPEPEAGQRGGGRLSQT